VCRREIGREGKSTWGGRSPLSKRLFKKAMVLPEGRLPPDFYDISVQSTSQERKRERWFDACLERGVDDNHGQLKTPGSSARPVAITSVRGSGEKLFRGVLGEAPPTKQEHFGIQEGTRQNSLHQRILTHRKGALGCGNLEPPKKHFECCLEFPPKGRGKKKTERGVHRRKTQGGPDSTSMRHEGGRKRESGAVVTATMQAAWPKTESE